MSKSILAKIKYQTPFLVAYPFKAIYDHLKKLPEASAWVIGATITVVKELADPIIDKIDDFQHKRRK